MKRVTIGIEMDEQFISLLRADVGLANLREKDELTPSQQLALVALLEARGALEEQVHAAILPAWRANLNTVSELRQVKEN